MAFRINIDKMERILSESIPENRKAFYDFISDLNKAERYAKLCKPQMAINMIQDAVEKRRLIISRPYMTAKDAHEFVLETMHALQDVSDIVQKKLEENCSCKVNYL